MNDRDKNTFDNLYKRIYTKERFEFFDLLDFESYNKNKEKITLKKDYDIYGLKNKKVVQFYNDKNNKKIEFSGDTDYNVKEGFGHNRICLSLVKEILKSEQNKDSSIINDMNILQNKMYSFSNFSIMPVSGSLNNAKQGICNDRFDLYIYMLDKYYMHKKDFSSLILGYSSYYNINILKNYLDLFDNVYDYCEKIYLLDNNDKNNYLVDRIKETGRECLDSILKIKKWIELIKEMYEYREIKLQKMKIIK